MRTGIALAGILGSIATTAVLVTWIPASQPASATPLYDSYVALGDSFTSGPGIPPTVSEECGRSGSNYPTLVAEVLNVSRFVDVSCGGAVSGHLTESQATFRGVGVPPQYEALTPDTDLVTVGIGGNDIGLVQLAAGCINLLPPPNGQSCAATNTAGGADRVDAAIDAFVPRYETITAEIRQRSPDAKIVFVGYPTAVRDGGCFPEQRLWPEDATYLQNKLDRLNSAMHQQVQESGAEFVDLTGSTVGHDVCADPDTRWMEGLSPVAEAIPLHPNAAGHRNAADQVVASLLK